ncbi:MAG: ABC transporter permease [Erysipelotrichaceae bacterium]|nr:ABC transporter permease [Erysipelotrichaceae bacterium]
MWLVSNIWYHRRQFYLNIVANAMAVFLILMVSILSDNVIRSIDEQLGNLGLNVTMLQVFSNEEVNDKWFEDFINEFDLETASVFFSYNNDDHVVARCDADLGRMFCLQFRQGSFLDDSDIQYNNNYAVLGSKVSEKLGVSSVGDKISINGISFRVKGILEESDDNLFVDVNDSVLIPSGYDFGNSVVNRTYYFINNARYIDGYLDEVLGEGNYLLINQSQLVSTTSLLTEMISNVLMFIASVSLLVSLIGMINSMLSNIRDRTYEIGIKKAMGAGNNDIYIEFLMESFMVFALGTFIGWLLIISFVGLINLSGLMSIRIDYHKCLTDIVRLLVAGGLCGIYPACKASHITIMDAIRKV